MREVEADLLSFPEVKMILSEAGGGWIGGVSGGDVHVALAPHSERYWTFGRIWRGLLAGDPLAAFRGNYTQEDVIRKIRRELGRKYAARGLSVRVRGYSSFNIGGGNFDIDFSISGPDLQKLAEYSEELARRAEQIGGIININ